MQETTNSHEQSNSDEYIEFRGQKYKVVQLGLNAFLELSAIGECLKFYGRIIFCTDEGFISARDYDLDDWLVMKL